MMLMHSMNKLASTFITRLSTGGAVCPDDQDGEDRSTSNTSDLETDCFSSATEGDYTIRDRASGAGRGGRKGTVTVWDDSDVSDVDITLRGNNAANSGWSMRSSSSPSNNRRAPVVVTTTNSSSSPSPSPSPFDTVRRGVATPLWGASLRPYGTFYRSLSFELDSAGNTIRPKPKRQKDKDKEKDKENSKEKSRKHQRMDKGISPRSGVMESENRLIMSSNSAMLSPRRSNVQQKQKSPSLSPLSSDDESHILGKDRPRMRKKTKSSLGDKGARLVHHHLANSLVFIFTCACPWVNAWAWWFVLYQFRLSFYV
jgi:hypothetical protein